LIVNAIIFHTEQQSSFSIWYQHTEQLFMLALSHDEVVHGKSNFAQTRCTAMTGQKFRICGAPCWPSLTHPGKNPSSGHGVRSAAEWNVWGILNGICSSSIAHSGPV